MAIATDDEKTGFQTEREVSWNVLSCKEFGGNGIDAASEFGDVGETDLEEARFLGVAMGGRSGWHFRRRCPFPTGIGRPNMWIVEFPSMRYGILYGLRALMPLAGGGGADSGGESLRRRVRRQMWGESTRLGAVRSCRRGRVGGNSKTWRVEGNR